MRPIQMFALSVVCASFVGLAGCERTQTSKVATQSPPAGSSAPAPSLWRIEAINEGRVVGTVDICADQVIQGSFSRPTPEFKGQPCDRAPNASDTDGNYAARCRMDHNNYVVSATRQGDPARDFTVQMAIARQDKVGPTFEQSRHYSRLGACPAGWQAGDSAAPGSKQIANTLAGSAGGAGKTTP
jgi:hypothetical protein